MCIDVRDDQFQPESASRQLSQISDEYHKFNDSSGPLFSMYSEIAEGEDNKMVKQWQKDSEGILTFVRPHVVIHSFSLLNWVTIDRFPFCCCCRAACHVRSGPEAKLSGHFRILPREHLSDPR